MANFGNGDRANNANNTVTELFGDPTSDTITLSGTFIISPATSGLIDGGAGTDSLELAAATLTDVQIVDIENTQLTSNGVNTVEADQIVNLGTLSLSGFAATLGFANLRLAGDDGDVADFSGLSLLDGEEIRVSSFGFPVGTTVFVSFANGVFAGDSFVDFEGASADDDVTGGSGNDDIDGNAGDDTLRGGDGDDTLTGGSGTNDLQGDAGNDLLISDASANGSSFDGGADNDTIRIAGSMTGGVIDGGSETDRLELQGANLTDTTVTGIENTAITTVSQTQLEADQVANLGILTLDGITSANLLVQGDDGDIANFAGLSLADGQQVILSTGFASGTTITVSFAGASFAGSSFVDFNGGSSDEDVTGGTGNDDIDGNAGDDTLRGGDGDDTLTGGSGTNDLQGDGGNDLLISDATANGSSFDGGANNDTIRMFGTMTGGTIDGGSETDRLEISGSNLTDTTITGIESSAFITTSQARIEADQIANLGTLTLEQASASLRVEGDDGDSADFSGLALSGTQRFFVSTTAFGTNTTVTTDFSGGSFSVDSLLDFDGSSADNDVTGGSGNDDIDGNAGDDTLRGGDGDDTLTAGSGEDDLQGDGGNDLLIADTTSDNSSFDGGEGDDTIRVFQSATNSAIEGGDDTDRLELSSATLTDTTISGIESTALTTSSQVRIEADQIANLGTLTLEGSAASVRGTIRLEGDSADIADFSNLSLADGQELLVSGQSFGTGTSVTADFSAASFVGSSFINYDGSSGADSVVGGSGNDDFTGGNGDDVLEGGFGDDTLDGNAGNDTLRGNAGNDKLISSSSTLNGLLDGGEDNDLFDLNGAFTNGAIVGGSGTDTIEMTPADYRGTTFSGIEQTIIVSSGLASIDANQIVNLGDITLSGSAITSGASINLGSSDGVAADFSRLSLGTNELLNLSFDAQTTGATTSADFSGATFGAGSALRATATSTINTTVIGGSGDDTLTGSTRDDSLVGGAGDDSITGGGGDNRLQGGDGNDTIVNNTTATGLIDGGANDDLLDINGQFTGGVITGGSGFDTLELAAAIYSGTVFSEIEQTILQSQSNITIDAAQVENLGTISLAGSGSGVSIGRFSLTDLDGNTADFSDLTLAAGERFEVSFANEGLGTASSVDFRNASFAGDSFVSILGSSQVDLTAFGGTGNDVFTGSSRNESVVGGAGDDTLNGSSGANTLEGGLGNDVFVVNSFSDGSVLQGDEDNDLFDLNTGIINSSIHGGTGTDRVELSGGTYSNTTFSGIEQTILQNTTTVAIEADQIANLGDITILGLSARVSLNNSNGFVTDFSNLTLGAGQQLTIGASGLLSGDTATVDMSGATLDATSRVSFFLGSSDDTYIASAAIETINGSSGTDTVSYEASTEGVTVNLRTSTVTGGFATGDSISLIENAIGSAQDDLFTSSAQDNSFDGGDGTDVVTFSGNSTQYTITTVGDVTTVVDNRNIFQDDGTDIVENVEVLRFADGVDIVIGNVTTPTVSIAADVSDQSEGDTGTTSFTFTLTRVGSTVGTSSVDFAVSALGGANAAEASDFAGGTFPTGTVTFADGEDTKSLTIDVVGDTAFESDELFRVTISNPQNATILTDIADGAIRNDDVTSSSLGVTTLLRPGIVGTINALAFDEAANELFILNSSTTIFVVDAATGETDRTFTIPTGGGSFDLQILPEAITLGGVNLPSGSLISVNRSGLIEAFDKTTGASLASQAATGLSDIVGGAYNPVTGTFFAVNFSSNVISEVSLVDGSVLSSFDIDDVFGEIVFFGDVTVDPTNGDLLVVGSTNNTLLRFGTDGDLKDATPLPSGVNSLSGVAFAGPGEVWVTETGGDIFRLDAGSSAPFFTPPASQIDGNEGNNGTTNFNFSITRSGDLSGVSTIDFEVRPVGTLTAAEADDFVGGVFPSGTITFQSGISSQNIVIPVLGDTDIETNEFFEIVLSNPSNGILPVGPNQNSVLARIINDDVSTTPSTVISSFDPANLNTDLVGLAFDETTGEVFVYQGSTTTISVYDEAGTFLRTIPSPELSQWGDMDVAEVAFTLNGVNVPAGSLLYNSGANNPVTVYAVDPSDGTVIASLATDVSPGTGIGMTFDQNTGTFLFLNFAANSIVEVSAATGDVLSTVTLGDNFGYSTSFGDIDIDPVNGDIFVIGSGESTILHLSRSFELIDEIPLPPAAPSNIAGISLISDREAFVAERTGEVTRIGFFDPATFPTAVDDVIVTNEDTPGTVNLITGPGADSDPEGDVLSIVGASVFGVTPISIGSDSTFSNFGRINIASNGDVTYTPTVFNFLDDGESQSVFLTYTVADGNGGTDEGRLDITINGVNDAPSIAPTIFLAPLENQTFVSFVGGSDPDGDPITYSISGGDDQALFTIDENNGSLSFVSAPDFETPEDQNGDNFYEVEVSLNDGDLSTPTDITVQVRNVNEQRFISINNVSQNEGDAGETAFTFTISLTEASTTDVTFDARITSTDANAADFGAATPFDTPIPLTIPAGETRITFDVLVVGDLNSENSELFDVTLENIVGAEPLDVNGLGVIVNDDGANNAPIAVDDDFATDEDVEVTGNVLSNDSDPDGDTLSATIIQDVSNGTLVFTEATGAFSYTPDADFSGEDTFTYQTSDGRGGVDSAIVTITVNDLNEAPVAADDTATTDEDNAVNIAVLGNDTDGDGDTLSVASATNGTNGVVTIENDGTISYTPISNRNGTDSFTYTIDDGNGGQDTATVRVTINAVNDNPIADNDAYSLAEDTTLTVPAGIGVLNGDIDLDGDSLSVSRVINDVNSGSLVLNSDGSFEYTPDPDFTGADGFTYEVSDGNGGLDTATVSLTVGSTNDAPIGNDDTASTREDNAVNIDVLANDTDADGDTLTIVGASDGSNGSVQIESDGTLSYTPDANFSGTDSFTYTVDDGNGGQDTATVRVTVDPENDAPVAADNLATTDEDTPVNIDVLGNDSDIDGDTLTVSSASDGTNGTVTIETDGTLTYAPNANFNGTDSFTYTVDDGNGGQDTATVDVTINAENDAPVAGDDDGFTTDEDTPLILTRAALIANDTDVDGDTLSVAAFGPNVTQSGDDILFTPPANQSGTFTVLYQVSDGNGGSDIGSVEITVNPVNDPPVAADDLATTDEDTAVNIDVLGNDTDVDGDTLSVFSASDGTNGTVTIETDGTLTYAPNANFNGTDSFTYTVDDGNGGQDTATVDVTINAVNDPPVAGDDSANTNEDVPVEIDVLANDSDVEGDTLTVLSVFGASNGTPSIQPNGRVLYTPDEGFFGTDSFSYTVGDGNGGETTATVTVTVNEVFDDPVNSPPVANDDSYSTAFGTALVVTAASGVLANDFDPDADSLSFGGISTTANGTLQFNNDGSFEYTPDAGFSGTDSFTYQLFDGQDFSRTATVEIEVAPNTDPVGGPDSYTTDEDQTLTVSALQGLLANDTDPEGAALEVVANTQPANGSVSVNPNGSFEFTPDADFNGTDSFTYTVSDGFDTAIVTVNVTVDPVNDAPEVTPISRTLSEDDAPIEIDLLEGAFDVDGDELSITDFSIEASDSRDLDIDPTGNLLGVEPTPFQDLQVGESLVLTARFKVSDGIVETENTAIITINGANDAPAVTPISRTISEDDAPIQINLLEGASDAEGDPLSITGFSIQASDGRDLDLDPTGNFLGIQPTPFQDLKEGESLVLTALYSISDGRDQTPTSARIIVTGVNDAPEAKEDAYSVNEDVTLNVASVAGVLANDTDIDGDILSVNRVTDDVDNGTLVLNADGSFDYTPDADFNGTDTFTYEISDGNGGLDTASVEITVNATNDDPVAQDDVASTDQDSDVVIAVLANDSDIEGDTLSVSQTGTPSNGSVQINEDDTITYTPDDGFFGTDSFTYEIEDGNGGSDTASVTVTVNEATTGKTLIEGTPNIDFLAGTGNNSEIFDTKGGAFDYVQSGGGEDEFVFDTVQSNGTRDVLYILDFDTDLDQLNLSQDDVFASFAFGGTSYVYLNTDFDTVILLGVSDSNAISFDQELLS